MQDIVKIVECSRCATAVCLPCGEMSNKGHEKIEHRETCEVREVAAYVCAACDPSSVDRPRISDEQFQKSLKKALVEQAATIEALSE
jgi:hypothetical protein